MISTSDRAEAIKLIDEAVAAGCRQAAACKELGLPARTVQRWRLKAEDGRATAVRPAPRNKLTDEERQAVLAAVHRADCASLTPHQIVPKLADEGVYLASESTFYRVLKAEGLTRWRGRGKAPKPRPLTTHCASGPNQVWCWDITWLPTTVKGKYFYWYMVKDIYSRKLVVNEVHETECSEHAKALLERGCLRERTAGRTLVLHSDNGSTMKGALLLSAMRDRDVGGGGVGRPRLVRDAGEQRPVPVAGDAGRRPAGRPQRPGGPPVGEPEHHAPDRLRHGQRRLAAARAADDGRPAVVDRGPAVVERHVRRPGQWALAHCACAARAAQGALRGRPDLRGGMDPSGRATGNA
jgi:transposase InsO family protein